MNSRLRSLLALVPLVLSTPAWASDWYVDVLLGNDANGGTSPTDAWRTITHAVANTPMSGVQTIHIASGVYSPSTGEQFPIAMRPDLQLVGAPAPSRPRLTKVNALGLIDFSTLPGASVPPGPNTLIENLVLVRAIGGIHVDVQSGSIDLTVRDVTFDKLSSVGLVARSYGGAAMRITLERFHYDHDPVVYFGGSPALIVESTSTLPTELFVRDSSFLHAGTAVQVGGTCDARFERCRMEASFVADADVGKAAIGDTHVVFDACSLSSGDNYGCRLHKYDGVGAYDVRFERCTIAGNGLIGIAVTGSGVKFPMVAIEQCVLDNLGGDLAISPASDVHDSLIRDGQFAGANGNFAADPQFVAALAGDWHLRWGSPCIDRIADPALAQERDLDGHARGVDGDLDLVERSDIGAFEFRPLELVGTGQIGSALELDSWGPQGNTSIVYWTRTGPVAQIATPFGEFDLDLALTRVFRSTSVGATTPTVIARHIPANPLLIGQTYAFQSLVDSSASSTGKAYTNPVAVTFVP